MAKFNRVAVELVFLTALSTIATLIMIATGHERRWLLALLTCCMALLMGVAQFRLHKDVRTIKGARGKRRRRKAAV